MLLIREIVACLMFIGGVLLLADLLVSGFAIGLLVGMFVCFWLAWWIWPSRRQCEGDNRFLDWLELIIELPMEIFLWLPRILIRLLRKGDGLDL